MVRKKIIQAVFNESCLTNSSIACSSISFIESSLTKLWTSPHLNCEQLTHWFHGKMTWYSSRSAMTCYKSGSLVPRDGNNSMVKVRMKVIYIFLLFVFFCFFLSFTISFDCVNQLTHAPHVRTCRSRPRTMCIFLLISCCCFVLYCTCVCDVYMGCSWII